MPDKIKHKNVIFGSGRYNKSNQDFEKICLKQPLKTDKDVVGEVQRNVHARLNQTGYGRECQAVIEEQLKRPSQRRQIRITEAPNGVGALTRTVMEVPMGLPSEASTKGFTKALPDLEGVATDKFKPSSILTKFVDRHMIRPDKGILNFFKELGSSQTDFFDRPKLKDIISEQIEDLFTSLAEHIYLTGEDVKISTDTGFVENINEELIDRLDLETEHAHMVLNLLFTELRAYASKPRKRDWGEIRVEYQALKISLLNPNVFIIPSIDEEGDEDQWEVME